MRVRHPDETDVKKSRFNEAQIIGVLREQEAGEPDRRGLSPPGGQRADVLPLEGEVQRHVGVRRPKAEDLEDENRLKKLLGESILDVAALKDLLGKN